MLDNTNNWNFLENLLGFNFNRNRRYIEQFRQYLPYQNQIWGVKQAVWIDTNHAYRHYLDIPELRAVIDKRASMMSAAMPCLYDKDGNKVEKHWIYDLIAKPNPTQSWSDVIYCLSVNDALYSNSFAFAPARTLGVRNLIVPLPSHKMQIKLSGKTLKQMDIDGLIEGYKFAYDDEYYENFTVEEILYLCTTDGMNIINPSSKIETLKYPLSNIKAAYNKRNVLLENLGAIGILSAQKTDMAGAMPMDPQEKKNIQMDWYRRSKDELIITEAQVDWKPMSFPTRDLMLFEEMTADKLAIIDAYGLNANLFSSEQGSTFTNVRDSIRMVYTDTIIPETQQMYDAICQQWGLSDEGYYLEADFGHLKVLQEDEERIARVQSTKADTLQKIINMGVPLSEEEIRTMMDI
jgi:phage portal protein BeeE